MNTQPQPQHSSPGIEIPLQNLSKNHPWASQILVVIAVGFAGLFSGKFVWDDNAKAIQELNYELKALRVEVGRMGEANELAKENAIRIAEIEKNDLIRSNQLTLIQKSLDTLEGYHSRFLDQKGKPIR